MKLKWTSRNWYPRVFSLTVCCFFYGSQTIAFTKIYPGKTLNRLVHTHDYVTKKIQWNGHLEIDTLHLVFGYLNSAGDFLPIGINFNVKVKCYDVS